MWHYTHHKIMSRYLSRNRNIEVYSSVFREGLKGCSVMLFIVTINKQVDCIPCTCMLSGLVLHHPQMETGRCSSVRIDSLYCDAPGWPSESAAGLGGGRRRGKEKWRGREVAEHCSADKLMQQSRLSQQHTPTLAHCLWFACTYTGNRLRRSG